MSGINADLISLQRCVHKSLRTSKMFQVQIITRAFPGLKTTFSISVTFFFSVIDFVLLSEQVQHHQKLTFQSLFLQRAKSIVACGVKGVGDLRVITVSGSLCQRLVTTYLININMFFTIHVKNCHETSQFVGAGLGRYFLLQSFLGRMKIHQSREHSLNVGVPLTLSPAGRLPAVYITLLYFSLRIAMRIQQLFHECALDMRCWIANEARSRFSASF